MLTLVQFVTVDSLSSLYVDLIRYEWTLVFYFVPLILIVSIAMMNMVTAVIVEKAIHQAKQDKEAMKTYKERELQEAFPRLVKMFEQIDSTKEGVVSLAKFAAADENIRHELTRYLQADSLIELFEILDEDGSGEVSMVEFISRMTSIVGSAHNL